MKRIIVYLFVLAGLLTAIHGQEKKKKFGLKVPKVRLGEKIGKLAGNLMTGKTDDLSLVSVKNNFICGIYPPEIKTSEIKFFEKGLYEGDYIVSISFLKQEGIGMLELQGEVTVEGEPMEYVGLGSYAKSFGYPLMHPVVVRIKTESGDEASFTYNPIPKIEFVSVNGETALPILDMDEDIELVYYNPPGAENTKVKLSLITDVAGARALNHFAEFKSGKEGEVTVTIPKESLASPEIAGQLNAGNFNKGENYLILERELITNKDNYGPEQQVGKIATSDISVKSYTAMPVIVKGKQDGGLLVSLKVSGKSENKTIGYDLYKPNATTGIPFSQATKFGLVSFTMSASTYKRESETSSNSYTVGNTRYTTTTTRTTTWEFPQLPDSYWNDMMQRVYEDMVAFFKSEYNVDFVPVEAVTSTNEYATLFPSGDQNTETKVEKSYMGTNRVAPQRLGEFFANASSNLTSDNPTVNMMKNAGDIDGLVSMHLDLVVGSNDAGNIVLFPKLAVSGTGRDENNNDKQGTYFNGVVARTTGEPFNEDLLKSNPSELTRIVSWPKLQVEFEAGMRALRSKEIELGFDRIWSIGESED
ncbi:MAG: hypothetical protein ABJP45_01825 [Cyclobacteriaceae bacterium]